MRARLSIKVGVPILAASVLVLAVGASAAWYVHSYQHHISQQVARDSAGIRSAEELTLAIRECRVELDRYLLSGDESQLAHVTERQPEICRLLDECESLASSTVELELLSQVRRGCKQLSADFAQALAQPTAEARHAAFTRLVDEQIPPTLLAPAQAHLDLNEDAMAQTAEDNHRHADRVALGLLLLGITGAVAGLLAGFGLARGVSRSIVQLQLPIRDATGKLEEVVGPVEVPTSADNLEDLDHTLHRLSEHVGTVVERLQQSEREVLRAEQFAAVGQLAAGLAHELRNPLMSMKLLVQSAVEDGADGALRGRHLSVLDEEIRRQERSIQAFCEFAKPARAQRHPFDLAETIKSTLALVSGRAELQHVEICCDAPVPEMWTDGDADQLRQVLINLLINALDVLPEGGQIQISMRPPRTADGPGANDPIVIQVADNGPGLPDSLAQRLFDPFVSSKETGLGLGLAICKRIIEDHDGTIRAENGVGRGAVFTIALPRLAVGQSHLLASV